MLLRLVWALAGQIVIGGETFGYKFERTPVAPFAAEVEIREESNNAAVFLYSDQRLQRVRISVAVEAARSVNVTLFQFQTVPMTLYDSEVTFRVDSSLEALSMFGNVAPDAQINVADSAVTYKIRGDIASLTGLGDALSGLTVKNSKVSIFCAAGARTHAVTGLATQVGELALKSSAILFQIEDWVDEFVGLVCEQQGGATVANVTLSGEIAARTSAFGLFRETKGAARLQNSTISVSLAVTEDGTVALLAETVMDTFAVTHCTLNATAQRGSSVIQ